MPKDEGFIAIASAVNNINSNTNYMRERLDKHIENDETFKRDISLDLQNIHLTVDKKLELFIEDQKVKNETFEKNDMKLSRAIESIVKKLPPEGTDWKYFSEIIEWFKDKKDENKKIKFSLKEKFALMIMMLISNASLLFIIIPLFKLFGIDLTKLKP
jgi:lipopolysaccharide export LptBFGC system permease protein LptF